MNKPLDIIIVIWPLIVTFMAWRFYLKQNGDQAWTGGSISWPKSFWLAYTTTTWFLFPMVLFFQPDFPEALKELFIFHLASWWIRGLLELVMIYKWYNWTPRYGICHDIFHILFCSFFLYKAVQHFDLDNTVSLLAVVFSGMIIFATCAEILFAVMFLKFRSRQEASENIYFASNEPKWLLINRTTLTVVWIVMLHLVWQSFAVLQKN